MQIPFLKLLKLAYILRHYKVDMILVPAFHELQYCSIRESQKTLGATGIPNNSLNQDGFNHSHAHSFFLSDSFWSLDENLAFLVPA